ncbi:efflux RND transporter periplasmic adaptor subunit [Paraglaciecola sp.]|uniref:efflux RND transporter periplasmic adaptor subunit n=1 Tax=Paraglaciecola sp. TaxID=1920173 RepID=UPI0030F46964
MSLIRRIWHKSKGIVFALVFAFVVLIFLDELDKAEQKGFLPSTEVILPRVSVSLLRPSNESLMVSVLSKVRPKHKSIIISQVDGQIETFEDVFLEGNIVQKGQVLVVLDNVEQIATIALAKLEQAEAKLALLQEQRLAEQARRDWQRSNKDKAPPSPLVIREPQLEAANLRAQAALAELARAERQLSFTRIKAPYTGVIISRQVNPGDVIGINQPIAEVMSIDEFELVAQLTETQWAMLAPDWQHQTPIIEDFETGKRWLGDIRSSGHFYDESTQLRNIYVTALAEQWDSETLLPGKLMQVSFMGKTLNNVFRVPLSAYTQDASIWVLGNDDRLQKISPKIIAQNASHVFFAPLETSARSLRVTLYPQTNFTLGQKVEVELISNQMQTPQVGTP